jgi:hypothetical protein
MVKVETKTMPLASGTHDERKDCARSGPTRLFTPLLISGLLLALGATSWFLLYVSNINVGD